SSLCFLRHDGSLGSNPIDRSVGTEPVLRSNQGAPGYSLLQLNTDREICWAPRWGTNFSQCARSDSSTESARREVRRGVQVVVPRNWEKRTRFIAHILAKETT